MGTSVKDIRSKNQGSGNNCVLDAFSVDPASGDAIFAVTASFSSVSHSAPTDSMGSTYTQIGSTTDYSGATGGFLVSFWYAQNVSGGSGVQVTLKCNNPFGFMGGCAWLLTGVPASAYNGDGSITTGSATSTPTSPTASTPAGATFFIGAIAAIRNTSDPSLTDGSGWNTTGQYGMDASIVARAETGGNSIYVSTEYKVSSAGEQATWGANATALTYASFIASFGSEDAQIDGAFISSGSQLFAGHIPQDASGAHLSSGGQLFAGSVTADLTGATIASGHVLFAGAVTTDAAIDGATIASGSVLFAGAVVGSITGARIQSGLQLFAGSVAPWSSIAAPIEVSPSPVIGPLGSLLYIFSDIEMNCPAEWYGGPKDARVERTGYGERTASDFVTGEPTSATMTFRLADKDFFFRRAMASRDRRHWIDPVTVHMTTRDNRAALGQAYLVFVGPIIDAQPARPLAWEFTLADVVTQRIRNDRAVHPSRLIGDGFIHDVNPNALGTRVLLSSALNYETPEPTIYGEHRRVRDVDPPSAHGFEVDLTEHYLGIWNIDGSDKHVWIAAAHACAGFPDVNVVAPDGTHTTVIPDEGLGWWIPHYAGWTSIFGAPYVDIRSTSFGNDRRYALILGLVGLPNQDACAYSSGGYAMDPAPEVPLRLMAFIDGIEPNGDGSGGVIWQGPLQYKHWQKNYGTRTAADSYQAGPWKASPVWSLPFGDGDVPLVDEPSYDVVQAIGELRYPSDGGEPPRAGIVGAAIIGAKAGDVHPLTYWEAVFNRSNFTASGWTRRGQHRIGTPHPTEAVKAAARLYTDALEMREGSFETIIRGRDQANRIPWRNDPDYASGTFKGSGKVDAGDSIANYDREILGAERLLNFAPGVTMATHIAFLHSWLFKDPPRDVVFEDTVGPDPITGESLGYSDLFDWIAYRHYGAVGTAGQIRLAWIVRNQVQAGARKVLAQAWDLDDLIGFDIPIEVAPTVNDTCETAITIPNGPDEPYAINLDTTAHATDSEVAGIAGLPGPAVGYHPAHFAFTPPSDGTLFLTTVHSLYDTQLAACTGACGALELMDGGYNDNDGILKTSVLELAVAGGVPLHIIVYGYGPDDGGALTFGLLFTAT